MVDIGTSVLFAGVSGSAAADTAAVGSMLIPDVYKGQILEIPTLEEYGIDRERYFSSIDKMAEDAMLSGSPSNTRKQLDSEDLKNIYRSLWA